jgi:hypothetical protein
MYSEKRNKERIKRNNRVIFVPYSALDSTRRLAEIPAKLEDISREGVCLIADTELIPGVLTHVKLDIEVVGISSSRGCRFASDAEVRWVKELHEEGPYKMGLKFVNTSKVDLQIWLDFVGKSRTSLY